MNVRDDLAGRRIQDRLDRAIARSELVADEESRVHGLVIVSS
jgi:hypothetical protein